jgi:hypothetical protein
MARRAKQATTNTSSLKMNRSRPPGSPEGPIGAPAEKPASDPLGDRYGEVDTHAMVFELQGTVHEIKETLRLLAPKIDDIAGFIRHRAPDLVDKTALGALSAELKAEINKRPTRRQTVFDIAWVVALITGAVTFGSHLAH